MEIFGRGNDFASERFGAFAALGKTIRDGKADAEFSAAGADNFDFSFGIRVEVVECHHNVRSELLEVGDVSIQIDDAALDRFKVGLADFGKRHAAVPLQRFGARNDDYRGRGEAGGAALDIEELLCAEVRTKARFSDGVVGKLHRRTRGRNRIAAMGDVGKRTAVDEGEVAFDRLHEVGLEGFKKQSQKGARGTEFAAGVGRAVRAQAQNDAVDAAAKIF